MKKSYLFAHLLFLSTAQGMNLSVEEELTQATESTLHNLHTRAMFYKKTKKLEQYQETLRVLADRCIINLTPGTINIFNKAEFSNVRTQLQHYYLYARFKLSSFFKSDQEALAYLRQTETTIERWRKRKNCLAQQEYVNKIKIRINELGKKIKKNRNRKNRKRRF